MVLMQVVRDFPWRWCI